MNYNILAADINNMSVYDFLKDGETKEELQNRADTYRKEDIEICNKNRKKYPCEMYENYYKAALEKEYKVMTWDEFQKARRDFYIDRPLEEVTEDQYNEMLNILPPLKWCTIDGIEMFCISEMYDDVYTNQYARYKDKYYTKLVDIIDQSTWINNYIRKEV
jgi:hypothetical protein